MKQEIEARFTDDMLHTLLAHYQIDPDTLERLGSFESFIYAVTYQDTARILRVSHSDHYPVDEIRGELDWLRHLAAGGARVAAPVSSPQGNSVETVDDGAGACFVATIFERAAGNHIRDTWSAAFIQHYGETLGRIHRLSNDYTPSNPAWKRPQWDAPHMLHFSDYLRDTMPDVHARLMALHAYLKRLPRDQQSYGLIHQDAHMGNFFVQDGEITLFDFADAVYSWYAYDIALVLFYAIRLPAHDSIEFATRFMTHFLMGYQREYKLAPRWLREMPYFLKIRELDLFAIISRDLPDVPEQSWPGQFMQNRRQRIINDVPVIDLDFTQFAPLLHNR